MYWILLWGQNRTFVDASTGCDKELGAPAAEREEIEARRRQGMLAINDFIDMQLLEADKLDKNNDGKISQRN